MYWLDIVRLIPWKKVLQELWPKVLPRLEDMVEDTSTPWDDRALSAVKYLVEKFILDKESDDSDFDESDFDETEPEDDNDTIHRVLGEKL